MGVSSVAKRHGDIHTEYSLVTVNANVTGLLIPFRCVCIYRDASPMKEVNNGNRHPTVEEQLTRTTIESGAVTKSEKLEPNY